MPAAMPNPAGRMSCPWARAWLLGLMFACRPHAPSGEPRIDIDTAVYDFGLVNEGPPIKHVFRIKNQGTAPLMLSNVVTSCGCTAATLGLTTLLPGGSGPLVVTMDTHGERGPGMRSITVSSNDPHAATSTLAIKYDVQPLLDLDRSFVQLATRKGSGGVERVWLTGQLVEQANLAVVVEGTKLVVARTIAVRAGGQLRKGIELVLRGSHGKSQVSGHGVVTIRTGLPSPAELSLGFAVGVR